jgi:hypothetical protein
VALLDGLPSLLDRPEIVVHHLVPVPGATDRSRMAVGAANDADDAVLGYRYFPSAAGAKSS